MPISRAVDVTRAVEERKESIVTVSLLMYVATYFVLGVGGISFQVQPAAGYYYYYAAPFNFTYPDPVMELVGEDVLMGVNITDEEDGDDIDADFYVNESLEGEDRIPSGYRAFSWANGTPEGFNEWYVEATDTDGNTNSSLVMNFTVDATPPAVSTSAASPTTNSSQSVNYTVTEENLAACTASGANVSWSCDESDPDSDGVYQGTCNPDSPMDDGTHGVNVSCTDTVGNTGFQNTTLTVDTTPPSVTCDGCDFPDPVGSGNDVTFDPQLSDATTNVSRMQVCEDSGGSPDCTDTYCEDTSDEPDSCSYTTPDDTYETRDYWVRATDEAGNTAEPVGPGNFTIKKEEGDSCSSDEACHLGECVEDPETGQSVCEATVIPEPGIYLSFE